MPVVVMDGESPWPAGRRFVISSQIAGAAALNSGVLLRNTDALDSGSLVIIDAIDIVMGVQADFILTMHDLGSITLLSGPFNPTDVSPAPPGRAQISNVQHANFQQTPSATTGYRYFAVPVSPAHFSVPINMPKWTISPQQELALWCATVNTQISLTVGGRYYAAA